MEATNPICSLADSHRSEGCLVFRECAKAGSMWVYGYVSMWMWKSEQAGSVQEAEKVEKVQPLVYMHPHPHNRNT